MATRTRRLTSDVVDEVAEIVRSRLSGHAAESAEAFIRRFYRDVPPDDVIGVELLAIIEHDPSRCDGYRCLAKPHLTTARGHRITQCVHERRGLKESLSVQTVGDGDGI